MTHTHWKRMANPNYLGAYSLEDNKDIILTIDFVRQETVIGADGKKDDCIVAHWIENQKPMILNSTNCKMIAKLVGSPYIEDWHGKKIQIGIEKVKAFGDIVEALRVRKFLPKATVSNEELICEICGGVIKPAYNKTAEEIAQSTKAKYGHQLCAACATKEAQKGKES